MTKFKLKLADRVVNIESRFDSLLKFCEKFLYDGNEEDFAVSVTDEQIQREKEVSQFATTDSYAESTCIYRAIAENLPTYDAFVFHGAAITYRDRGFVFTAPSGTGKSTHIKLWKKYIGSLVDIVNGDKPIIKCEAGRFLVCGSPWSGKENWGKNRKAPLSAICIIEQSAENSITLLAPGDAVKRLLLQTYRPKKLEAYLATLELIDKLLSNTPVYLLRCDMSEDAVKTSFEALTGEEYK